MMVNKIMFGVTFVALGALAAGWWHNDRRIVLAQQDREKAELKAFMAVGARFTAQDGQKLCERIVRLEAVSYGFRDSHLPPLPCEFVKK